MIEDWLDDWGWPALIIAGCVVLIAGLVWLSWWAWPKDSRGNPLPCTHYETIYIYEKIGNSTYLMPVQSCDRWASPSPSEHAG